MVPRCRLAVVDMTRTWFRVVRSSAEIQFYQNVFRTFRIFRNLSTVGFELAPTVTAFHECVM